MDASQIGLVGGIAGGVIGLAGGALGAYASIRNARGPRERTLAVRLSALCGAWVAATCLLGFLMPRPWNGLAVVLNLPLLLSIPRMNRALAGARSEDGSARAGAIEAADEP
jgi:hypothetical protein